MPTHKESLNELSLSQIENLTGLVYRALKRRLGDLEPVRKDGKTLFYNPRDAFRRILASNSAELNPMQERGRLWKTQADLAELDLRERIGELVEAQEAREAVLQYSTLCRNKLMGIPVRAAQSLSGETDIHKIEALLRGAINEALDELAGANGPCGVNTAASV